jgi:segregation and condensation protein B
VSEAHAEEDERQAGPVVVPDADAAESAPRTPAVGSEGQLPGEVPAPEPPRPETGDVEQRGAAAPEADTAQLSEAGQLGEAGHAGELEQLAEAEQAGAAAQPDETGRPGDVDPWDETAQPDETAHPGEAAPEADAEPPDAEPPETAARPETTGEPAADGTAEADLVAVSTAGTLPDVSRDTALRAALEALLLVVDSPVSEESLAGALEQPVDRVTEMLRTMAEDWTDEGSGMDLRRAGEGWRLYTRDTYAPFVEKLLLDGQRSKLTRAALETLAVVAYRQPVTRSRVSAVRGVNVDGVMRTLLARGLVEESGADPETGGTLYVTTELFLERLGLSSLNELPPIAPLLPEVDSIDDV